MTSPIMGIVRSLDLLKYSHTQKFSVNQNAHSSANSEQVMLFGCNEMEQEKLLTAWLLLVFYLDIQASIS